MPSTSGAAGAARRQYEIGTPRPAIWVAAAPWLLGGVNGAARWSAVLAGLTILVASLRRGEIRERYGHWGRLIV